MEDIDYLRSIQAQTLDLTEELVKELFKYVSELPDHIMDRIKTLALTVQMGKANLRKE